MSIADNLGGHSYVSRVGGPAVGHSSNIAACWVPVPAVGRVLRPCTAVVDSCWKSRKWSGLRSAEMESGTRRACCNPPRERTRCESRMTDCRWRHHWMNPPAVMIRPKTRSCEGVGGGNPAQMGCGRRTMSAAPTRRNATDCRFLGPDVSGRRVGAPALR
jgi:hypothetical protein